MSSLKEKAKIIMNKPWLYEEQKKQQIMELFEDAQKEIEFQKARTDVANEMVTSKQKRIDELKQKLRCWYKQEAWFHLPLEVREHFLELLKEEKESLTIAEKDDVKASLKEIKEGRSKKFKNVNDFLKELKVKEAKHEA